MHSAEEKRFWYTLLGIGAITAFVFMLIFIDVVKKDKPVFEEELVNTIKLPELKKTDPMRGSLSPKLIVTVYNNFTCKNCAEVTQVLNQALLDYPNDLLVIWKDFPSPSLQTESERSALAARCAEEQKQFWPYHDYLMSYQRDLSEELYSAIANDLELKPGKFARCMKRGRGMDLVLENYQEGLRLELSGAPTIFLNTERVTGKITKEDIDWRMNMLLNSTP